MMKACLLSPLHFNLGTPYHSKPAMALKAIYLDVDLSVISVLTDIAEPTFLPSLFLSLQEAVVDQTTDHHEEFRLSDSSIAIQV